MSGCLPLLDGLAMDDVTLACQTCQSSCSLKNIFPLCGATADNLDLFAGRRKKGFARRSRSAGEADSLKDFGCWSDCGKEGPSQ